MEKIQVKELEKVWKDWRKLEGQRFNYQVDAEKALEQLNQKWKYRRAIAKMGSGWRPVFRAKTIKINGKSLEVYTYLQVARRSSISRSTVASAWRRLADGN